MEYIIINDSKLKVILDKEDFDTLDISVEELDYTNPDAKSAFENIFEHAKEELGFDTSGYRILLQLFPSKDGGCELFITKLGKLSSQKEEELRAFKQPKKETDSIKKAYSFDSLSSLLSVCKILSSNKNAPESSAFFDKDGKWYLLLSIDGDFDEDELRIISDLTFITEYGSRENANSLSLYLGEYGKEICEKNAIETLGKI